MASATMGVASTLMSPCGDTSKRTLCDMDGSVFARSAGRIVNVVSQAAFRGSTTGHADYAASKAGLVSLTISLAREGAPHGIAVNAIAPGMMHTDMAHDALEAGMEQYLRRIPLGRIGDPAEIAGVVAFLALLTMGGKWF